MFLKCVILSLMDPALIQKICIWVIPLIFAITVHEVAHGWVASKFGDQTARLAGRLTLNPIKHIDLIGTIVVPIVLLIFSPVIFGWAKPVPVDARNLRNPRLDMIFVALAGPISNFIMALLWALLATSTQHLSPWFSIPLVKMGLAGVGINVMLGVLNLLPIPPLDGSRVVYNLLPPRLAFQYSRIEPYGFIILLVMIFTNVLSYILFPPIFFLTNFILSVFGI